MMDCKAKSTGGGEESPHESAGVGDGGVHGEDGNGGDELGRTPLHRAAAVGGEEGRRRVRMLLEAGSRADEKDAEGMTPMHLAARADDAGVVALLVGAGADVNSRENRNGLNPVQLAVEEARADVAEFFAENFSRLSLEEDESCRQEELLRLSARRGFARMVEVLVGEKRADVNRADSSGLTPLHLAAEANSLESLEALLSAGAEAKVRDRSGRMPIHVVAAKRNGIELLDMLVDAGGRGKQEGVVDWRGHRGRTPLYVASEADVVENVEYLLERGADVNAGEEERGQIPLHAAARADNPVVAAILIRAGSPVDASDVHGVTPLAVAAMKDSADTAKVLVEAGADVDRVDKVRNAPAHVAATHGAEKVLRALAEKGADLGLRNDTGRTPIFRAVRAGDEQMATLLLRLDRQAFRTIAKPNKAGQTLLHQCASKNMCDLAEKFLDMGAAVNAVDNAGRTPLHLAAEGDHLETALLLTRRRAHVLVKDKKGDTPLVCAASVCEEKGTRILEAILDSNGDNMQCYQAMLVVAFIVDSPKALQSVLGRIDLNGAEKEILPHLAASRNSPKCFRWLREKKLGEAGQLETEGPGGMTPLLLAIFCDNVEVAKELLDAGAKVEASSSNATLPSTDLIWMVTEGRGRFPNLHGWSPLKAALASSPSNLDMVGVSTDHFRRGSQPLRNLQSIPQSTTNSMVEGERREEKLSPLLVLLFRHGPLATHSERLSDPLLGRDP